MIKTNWHQRFIDLAEHFSTFSKDPSTKVGAVIVRPETQTIISSGFNGFPRKVDEVYGDGVLIESRWEVRPDKYKWVEHAERNAIYNAARNGASTEGCVMYLNWSPNPCTDCARAIIQSGITKIYGSDRAFKGFGTGVHYDCDDISHVMLAEAEVSCEVVTDEYGRE